MEIGSIVMLRAYSCDIDPGFIIDSLSYEYP